MYVSACPTCRAEVVPGAKFCPECGTALAQRACPGCGAPAPSGRFCSECGTALDNGRPAQREQSGAFPERRVASVLFADLVGFTPLSETRDAEEVRDLLSQYFDRCRTVIGRYGGTVEKFIGDAVMAVWGVPVAREDDAERAVRAGLELLQAVSALGAEQGVPTLAMRVGVLTGEVAVTVGATAEGMVAGDAVNTAARIQASAEPGQVWVDDTTHALTASSVAYRDAGEHQLKGKAEPVHLWHAREVVAEVGGARRMDGLEAPLVGRAAEVRLIKDLFHATADAGRPRLVVLDGEAGVGKSRLAWEFDKYCDGLAATVRWHRGRCPSYGEGATFWALAEAVRGRLQVVESDDAGSALDSLDAGLAQYVADEAERSWIRPRLATLIGDDTDSAFPREQLFAAWAAFFAAVGGDAPVIWVIDDAQYADDALLDFVDYLLSTARHALFILALARPELLARRPDLGGRRTSVVRLDVLDEPVMAELLDGLVGELPSPVRDELARRSEGIPLFAVETVRSLIDHDLVVPSGGRYVATDRLTVATAEGSAPASLQALVAARLDTLTPVERQVVSDASVLGLAFTDRGLRALGDPSVDLEPVLASLQRKEIFSLETDRFSAERGSYRFVQGVVRQVAYSTLGKRQRKQRHLAAADFLESQQESADELAAIVAQHLLDAVDSSAATDDVDELIARACVWLERAADRARRLGSPGESLRLLETAIARNRDAADIGRLHQAAAEVAYEAGAWAVAISHAELARHEHLGRGDSVSAAMATGIQAQAMARAGDNAGAVRVAAPVHEALPPGPETDSARLRLASALSLAYDSLGDDRVAPLLDLRLQLSERLGDFSSLSRAHLHVGNRYLVMGAPVSAGLAYRNAAEIAREHGFPEALSNALNNLLILDAGRDLAVARGWADQALLEAHRSGVRDAIDGAFINRCLLLWLSGRLGEAATSMDEEAADVTDSSVLPIVSALGRWLDEARGESRGWPAVGSEDADQENVMAWVGSERANELVRREETSGVPELLRESLRHLLAASGLEDDFVHVWPSLVESALAVDDPDLAEELLEPVTDAPPGILSSAVLAHHRRLSGLIGAARGDDPARVDADLREGADQLMSLGIVGLGARAVEDHAAWLAGQGRHEEAAARFAQARSVYERIGASGWLAALDDRRRVASAVALDTTA